MQDTPNTRLFPSRSPSLILCSLVIGRLVCALRYVTPPKALAGFYLMKKDYRV